VVLFSLDRATNGPAAGIIASLVARDTAGLCQAGLGGDGLAWFSQCESADPQALADLVAAGSGAGLATVLTTTSAAAAGRLVGQAGVLVVHQLADATVASQLAGLTGLRLVPAGPGPGGRMTAGPLPAAPQLAAPPLSALPLTSPALAAPALAAPPGADWAPVVTGEAMCALPAGEFVLIRRGTPDRVVARAVSVPARIPGRRQSATRATPPEPADAPPADAPSAGARPSGAPPAGPGGLPWPNAPAWARGQLRRDQPR
jgi:hypothetical protein